MVQPWYADEFAMAGPVTGIAKAMRLLLHHRPSRGYYPEPSKSIFVCNAEDREQARTVLEEFNFRHLEGTRYIGGFIGSNASQDEWLQPQIDSWVDGVKKLAGVAKRYPQTAYAGLVKSLQTEWTYLQQVVPDVATAFQPIENAIRDEFLPALMGGDPPDRELSQLPVRYAGLGILDPCKNAQCHYLTSKAMTASLSSSLVEGVDMDAMGYRMESNRTLQESKAIQEVELASTLESLLVVAPPDDQRRMKRSQETGTWLTATPSLDYGTALSRTEFRDAILCLCHGLIPLDLPTKCDGCPSTKNFTMGHAFQCKKGGLVLARHDEMAAEWHQLCSQALTPSAVTDEPIIPIYQNQDVDKEGEQEPALRGHVSAHGFWSRGTTAIFDIHITDTDVSSYRKQDPRKVLQWQEREKKMKYGDACKEAHRHFTPLVYSVDGLEGDEVAAASKRLASRLAAKWNQKYAQVYTFVRSRMAFTLARTASRCIHGTRTPNQRPHSLAWAPNAGIRLYTQLF